MITLVAVIFFLGLSAFFSGSEIAFVSCSRIKIRNLIEQNNKNAEIVHKLDKAASSFLSTILLGNNLANVSVTVIFTDFMRKNCNVESELLITLMLAPVVIVFVENIPKEYFRRKADTVIYALAKPLYFWFKLTARLLHIVIKGSDAISKAFGLKVSKKSPFVTKEEIRFLFQERIKAGTLRKHEKDLIDLVFDFEKINAIDVMIPEKSLLKIELNDSIARLKELSRKDKAECVVIYDQKPDNIVGIVNVFDVLFEEDDAQSVKRFLRSPLFFSVETPGRKVFQSLQAERRSVALVVDKSGNLRGMIRIEDLLLL